MRWAPLLLGAVAVLLAGCGIGTRARQRARAAMPSRRMSRASSAAIPRRNAGTLETLPAFCGPQRAVGPVYMGPEGGHYIIQALGQARAWTVAFHCLTASIK